MGNGGSSESSQERSMTSIIEGEAYTQRGWLNIPLFFVITFSWITVLTFYLVFWIKNTDLMGSPSIVWSNALWFAPHLALTLTVTQIPLFGIKTHPIESPAIWSALFAIVAVIFTGAVSLFYQRLWWQCTLNTGSFSPREDEICDTEYEELSVIAWFNFVLFFHAIATIFTGFAIYYNDANRLDTIKAGVGKYTTKLKKGTAAFTEAFKKSEANIAAQQKLRLRNTRFANKGGNPAAVDGRAPSWDQ